MPNTKSVGLNSLPLTNYATTATNSRTVAHTTVTKEDKEPKQTQTAEKKVDAGGWIKFYSRGYQGL